MAKADKTWPTDYLSQFGTDPEVAEGGTENLCPLCFAVRSRPSRLKKLKRWTENENVGVIWIRVSLDYDLLNTVLAAIYLDYMKESNASATPKDAEVRLSVIHEFQEDYNDFLDRFRENLSRQFGAESIETVLKDMICLKSERTSNVFLVLKLLDDAMRAYFPKFKVIYESPVKVSIACCSSKFPFFEVWKILEAAGSSLQISVVGHGRLQTAFPHLEVILAASEGSYRKGALHKLAEVAKLSEKLAELKFADKRDTTGDSRTYESLRRTLLPLGMDFQSILTFAKMVGD
jgi:hypothetical protein